MPDRELIDANGAERYLRRVSNGRFTSAQVDARRSLSIDRTSKANEAVPKGQRDRGDQARRPRS
jgi:hypothetical protein